MKVKITKVRDWSINFQVDDKYYYLVPGADYEEDTTCLFAKDNRGFLKEVYGYFYPPEYIRYKKGRNTLSDIDIEYFIKKLVENGLWEES